MPARIVQSLDFEGRFRCAKGSWRGMNFQEQIGWRFSRKSGWFSWLASPATTFIFWDADAPYFPLSICIRGSKTLGWDPWSPKSLMIRVVTGQHPWVGWLASLASKSIFYPSSIGTFPYDFMTEITWDFTSDWWNPMFCPDCSGSSSPKNTLVRKSKRKMLLQNANHCCLRRCPFWSNSWSSNISNGPLEIRKKNWRIFSKCQRWPIAKTVPVPQLSAHCLRFWEPPGAVLKSKHQVGKRHWNRKTIKTWTCCFFKNPQDQHIWRSGHIFPLESRRREEFTWVNLPSNLIEFVLSWTPSFTSSNLQKNQFETTDVIQIDKSTSCLHLQEPIPIVLAPFNEGRNVHVRITHFYGSKTVQRVQLNRQCG